MSPDSPEFQYRKPDREAEKEARITALLLGELSPEESAQIRSEIEKDPALEALHQKLSRLLPWVKESMTSVSNSHATVDSSSSWQLPEEKRNQLVGSFQKSPLSTNARHPRTLRPRPRFAMTRDLLAIAALLLGIGLLSTLIFLKPRSPQELALVELRQSSERPEVQLGWTPGSNAPKLQQKWDVSDGAKAAAGVGGNTPFFKLPALSEASEGVSESKSKRYLRRAGDLPTLPEEPVLSPPPNDKLSTTVGAPIQKESKETQMRSDRFSWSKTNRINSGEIFQMKERGELDSKLLRQKLALMQDSPNGRALAPQGSRKSPRPWSFDTNAELSDGGDKEVTLSIESLSSEAPARDASRLFENRGERAVPSAERLTAEFPLSTFSLQVADVSFQLARESLARNEMPVADSIRSEEFLNAFDYHDPEPAPSQPIAFHWERARAPFGNRREIVRFSLKTAALGRAKGSPLSCVVLLDNSGSMQRADRIQIRQQALRELASQLQPQDRISLVTFARTARLWMDGIPGNEASQVVEKVSVLTPDGGTNIEEALKLAYNTALRHLISPGINRVILLTDGAANLGDANPSSLEKMVEQFRKQGVALDCFGIGWDGYNDTLLERLSRHGDGRYAFLQSPEEVARSFAAQLTGALQVAASDVKVQVEWNTNRVIRYRQIGYEQHQLAVESFRDAAVDAAEIGSAEAGNALYWIEVADSATAQLPIQAPLGTVRVRFKKPGTEDFQELEWSLEDRVPSPALADAPPTLRLAATAAWFAEWLAGIPGAEQISLSQMLQLLQGVNQHWPADPRPKQLEQMIQQTKSITGR